MAVSSEVMTFDDFHLVPEEFNALKRSNGTRLLVLLATLCACYGTVSAGHRDPACKLCYPLGFLYDAPVEVWGHGPNRTIARNVTAEGVFDTGEVRWTLPSTLIAPAGSRIIVPDAIERVSDLLTKGEEDVIRFARVVDVEAGLRVHRTPRTADPQTYDNELIPLERGVDFTIADGRRVVWPGGSPVADGTRYVLRLTVQSEYVVKGEPRTRVENGKVLSYVYTAQRYDFLLHPKGEEGALSF